MPLRDRIDVNAYGDSFQSRRIIGTYAVSAGEGSQDDWRRGCSDILEQPLAFFMPHLMSIHTAFSTKIQAASEVYLNRFLVEKGYLRFSTADPEPFEALQGDSQAFALDPSRIYVPLKKRYPRGSGSDRDYDGIRNKIRADLLALTDNGNKVIGEVYFKEEICSGDCFSEAPDLVLLPFDGYDLKGSLTKKEIFGRSALTGGHTRENALFYINGKIECNSPNIVDVGMTVLSLPGIAAATLDGKSLVQAT